MENQLKSLQKSALEELKKVNSLDDLRNLFVEYLGRKGKLTNILKSLKDLSDEEKRKIGQLSNTIKLQLEEFFSNKEKALENLSITKELEKDFFDTTLPATARQIGHIHPVSQVQEEVERIFSQMGFSIMDGP